MLDIGNASHFAYQASAMPVNREGEPGHLTWCIYWKNNEISEVFLQRLIEDTVSIFFTL
jgi:hypothetical protein